MDWSEYLDEITRGMDSPEAAAVREELRTHLEELRERFVQDGVSAADAAALALQHLGAADVLHEAFAEAFPSRRYPLWAWFLLIPALIAGVWWVPSAAVPGVALAISVAGGLLALGRPTRDRPWIWLVARWARTHGLLLATATLAGVIAAMRPWWEGSPVDGWPMWTAVAPIVAFALPWAGLVRSRVWYGGRSLLSFAWATGMAFAIAGYVGLWLCTRIWTHPPANTIDWYGTGELWGQQGPITLAYVALQLAAGGTLGVLAAGLDTWRLHHRTRREQSLSSV